MANVATETINDLNTLLRPSSLTDVLNRLNGTFTGQAMTVGTLALTDDMTVTDGKNIIAGATTGMKLGAATTQKIGFWNTTPVVQPTSANQAAVTTTGVTTSTPFGFATSGQGNSLVTLVNQIRSDLVAVGIIKGS